MNLDPMSRQAIERPLAIVEHKLGGLRRCRTPSNVINGTNGVAHGIFRATCRIVRRAPLQRRPEMADLKTGAEAPDLPETLRLKIIYRPIDDLTPYTQLKPFYSDNAPPGYTFACFA